MIKTQTNQVKHQTCNYNTNLTLPSKSEQKILRVYQIQLQKPIGMKSSIFHKTQYFFSFKISLLKL